MRSIVLATTLAAVVLVPQLKAQELGLFAATGHPRSGESAPYYGGGASLSGFLRLGVLVGPDLSSLKDSDVEVGLRLALSRLRTFGGSYTTYCDIQCNASPTVDNRLSTHQLSLLILPYNSARTRVELGMGAGGYTIRDTGSRSGWGLIGSLGVMRRLRSNGPLWASLAYEAHGRWLQSIMQDDVQVPFNADMAAHTFRFGISYRAHDRRRAPEGIR